MDVFTELEENQRPWDKSKFLNKCNEAYQVNLFPFIL